MTRCGLTLALIFTSAVGHGCHREQPPSQAQETVATSTSVAVPAAPADSLSPSDDSLDRAGLEHLPGLISGDTVPLPLEGRVRSGWLLSRERYEDLVFRIQEYRAGDRSVVVLDSLLRRTKAGKPITIVLDAFRLPPFAEPLALVTCAPADSMEDGHIFAIVRSEDTELLTDIRWAYTADVLAHRFHRRTRVGLRCDNEGWGA